MCRRMQSPVVLGVKPAIEDVDVHNFLAFLCTCAATCTEKDQIEPNTLRSQMRHHVVFLGKNPSVDTPWRCVVIILTARRGNLSK